MARKPKKPRHTKLVVPGLKEKDAWDREGEAAGNSGKREDDELPKATRPLETESRPEDDLPPNAVRLPTGEKRTGKKKAQRRKLRGRLRLLIVLAVLLAVLFVYFSGLYRTLALTGTELLESIRIAMQSGDGYPLRVDINGYVEAKPVGTSGLALLTERELTIVSNSGKELYRSQHGYGNPHITTGDTRVCVYNRGGTSYTIEGRDNRIIARSTENEILFAEMSPGGAFALVTASRYRSTLEVYSDATDDEAIYVWGIVDERPYSAAFKTDNKSLALACLSAEGGASKTTIHLLHIRREAVQATIDAGHAVVLQMHYLSSGQLLVVYDRYVALYGQDGTEIARYDYGDSRLQAADSDGKTTALVFSAASGTRLTTVILDSLLQRTGSVTSLSSDTAHVLVADDAVYLLEGYEARTYTLAGEQIGTFATTSKAYDIVWGGKMALLILPDGLEEISWLSSGELSQPSASSEALIDNNGSLPGQTDTSQSEDSDSNATVGGTSSFGTSDDATSSNPGSGIGDETVSPRSSDVDSHASSLTADGVPGN